jgi:MFS family permease
MPTAARSSPVPAVALALSVGLVLSDSSVVTLALPAILREFDASVSAVAWVLIAFNLALALAAVGGAWLLRGRGRRSFVVAVSGFAAASMACAAAPSLDVLIAARATQGVVGAVVVAAALELLLRRTSRGRAIGLWAAAGVLGGAVGPAAGGFLTEAFSWQAMFALQAPVALLALAGAIGSVPAGDRVLPFGRPATTGQDGVRRLPALAALALVSAALSAALFLLVVMLIEGWRLSPGAAALVVTPMPVAALVAGAWARAAHGLAPALTGSVLLAGGLAALGLLPDAGAAWTIAPQLAIGAGLGLAFGALIGVTVDADDDPARPAAWTIAARHAGIVAGLLVLTPLFAADLDAATVPAERAGLARVLDAPIALRPKLAIARALNAELVKASGQQLPDLDAAFAKVDLPASERADAARLHEALEGELDAAATSAFSRSFVAAALLALVAAVAAAVAILVARLTSPQPTVPASSNGTRFPAPSLAIALPAAATVATLLVAAYAGLGGATYAPTATANPCAERARPAVDRTQRATLATLDGAACELGTSRERLVRSLLDRRRPAGVSEDELGDALGKGIDRAEREGAVGGFVATALRLVIRAAGALGLVDRLLPG